MKYFTFILTLMISTSSFSYDGDTPINSLSELRSWCENNSKYYLTTMEEEASNWRSSDKVKGNTLEIKGRWRQGETDKEVSCSVLKGAPRKFIIMSIADQQKTIYTNRNQSEKAIDTGYQLTEWCMNKSAAQILGNGDYPYNWTSSHRRAHNTILVKGAWKVITATLTPYCSINLSRC